MAVARCGGNYSDSKPYVPSPQKVTHLHFFLHDTMSGKDPSAVVVARPNMTTASVPFGEVIVVDDPLTVGPNITAEVIGNTRGLSVSTGRNVLTLMVYLDFGFIKGEFKGSSISVFLRNPITETESELTVVGGRGKFKMAKGFAQLKTYFRNSTLPNSIVEYKVTVIHY